MLTVSSSTTVQSGLDLATPPIVAASVAFLVAILAGLAGWRMSNRMGFCDWIRAGVNAGPAWSPQDSWMTNIGAAGGILSSVISQANILPATVTADDKAGITLLLLVFGGMSAISPLVYAATAKRETTEIDDMTGSVPGFLLTGAVTLMAIIGEIVTVMVLVEQTSTSIGQRRSLEIALGASILCVVVYSFRALTMFATLPTVTSDTSSVEAAQRQLAARRSLLGSSRTSATL